MARVDDVEQHIGFGQLLERGAECGDDLVRELPDEPDRIREDERMAFVIAGDERGSRQAVQQRCLARVRVTDEGDDRHAAATSSLSLQAPVHLHALEVVADPDDALPDYPAIGLELRLARSPRSDTAAEPL